MVRVTAWLAVTVRVEEAKPICGVVVGVLELGVNCGFNNKVRLAEEPSEPRSRMIADLTPRAFEVPMYPASRLYCCSGIRGMKRARRPLTWHVARQARRRVTFGESKSGVGRITHERQLLKIREASE